MKTPYYLFVIICAFIVVLDQISKLIVIRSISFYESFPVIKGFFNIVHVRNRGIAFGLMNKPDVGYAFYILIIVTLLAIFLIIYWFTRLEDHENKLKYGLALILGGAVGNLIDRLRLKEVVDFLDFFIGSYHWPAFNVSDASITIGTLLVAFNLILSNKQG